MATHERFDVVLFGATGFTGRLTALHLAGRAVGSPLRWAIAGRSRAKLEARAQELVDTFGPSCAPSIVVADLSDEASLRAMAAGARVVATTVGPYLPKGEPLVRACVEAGAHYADLAGEPLFVQQMIERYHARAAAARVKIIHAAGFDSIPHDLGAFYALDLLAETVGVPRRELASVELDGVVVARGTVSGGTWHSALGIMSQMRAASRGQVHDPIVGEGRRVGALPLRPQWRADLQAWALPLPTIDPDIVRRSARLSPEYGRELRYGHFVGMPSLPAAAGLALGVGAVFALAQAAPTRKLLSSLRDPGDGPSDARRATSWFRVVFRAVGHGATVYAEVSGGDPGYTETSRMLGETALCLALDGDALPPVYGVVPTAIGLGRPLVARLREVGLRFERLERPGALFERPSR